MCGIVGYLGYREPKEILFKGLKRLEYRGYDSAGIALFQEGKIQVKRCLGKLSQLEEVIQEASYHSTPTQNTYIGIGHTRWATHGKPSEKNAHPHQAGPIVLVHNGIIENYALLREKLLSKGHILSSETDSEVVAYLIYDYFKKGLSFEEAVFLAIQELKGSYSLGILCEEEPTKLIAVRNGTPLVVGVGEKENFIASDIPALLEYTKRFMYLNDHEMVIFTPGHLQVKNIEGREIKKEINYINWTQEMVEKGGYQHFMLKEIHEQPQAIINTLQDRVSKDKHALYLKDLKLSEADIKNIRKIFLVACGTAFHASMVGKYLIEEMTRIPCELDLASEFRYRDPIIKKGDLLIITSQSGETADSLAALREAKKRGATVISICNVKGSSIDRESDSTIYTYAGPEIGVASTKAFMTQLTVFNLLAIHLGLTLKTLSLEKATPYVQDLVRLPYYVEEILKQEPNIKKIAQKFYRKKTFLYLGRGLSFPIALEGALKLKEISYINAEGYAAGEMKHGPIALVDDDTPVIILAPQDKYYEKVLSNLEEIKAREGIVIAIGSEGDTHLEKISDYFISIPKKSDNITPLLLTLPVQLIAYYIAVKKGTDVDQPRNLAKSVTVE
ncbi:MAG: glutamine--fructose-6-phosphate aminotransferase [Deltaproteobacteria bacterium GWA2_38_16]|nr:MAG: glutamine--fructose-6-phosphate aminotransferase [Deltaproteobacteria bacterium GWA2_38_16]OGQ01796.1 MAG: glutamine--fructose-6-phosphate aminotransferase [Deltaproteobacteria bacterium RIFCSPHIGHO2_02_FULL_38_15]OGQ30251.1 MAG: glutamine--fructose-6-phosphate aminotransferase [Deltaproteobacteria bacterium RIFCSPLOWO2_01_FULL_38_9]OGQ58896.1 MAG: glutamine--fructose-6-phosphate aminotransferase [Deltaproteobacteria bacterium RIFCSPLOWO2_12_FULL_38_8]HBQ21396.1 glutamine--fructose-6-ph